MAVHAGAGEEVGEGGVGGTDIEDVGCVERVVEVGCRVLELFSRRRGARGDGPDGNKAVCAASD